MSLHTLANHLQSAVRNGDSYLVHMTPDEVGGLQSLALAKGGSLTINPHTGLLEANFLSDAWKVIRPFAPMLAGAALAPLTAGTSLAFLGTPMGAAGLVGGGTALATGSLQKGLMAGIGAYGGAGIGAGLTAAGTSTMPATYTAETVPESYLSKIASAYPEATSEEIARSALTNANAAAAKTAAAAAPFQTMGQGIQALGTEAGRTAFMGGMGSVPNAGTAALGSMMMQPAGRPTNPRKDAALIRPYEFTRVVNQEAFEPKGNVWEGPVSSKEKNYFTDTMTPLQPYYAPGPEYGKKKNWEDMQGVTPPPGMYNYAMDPRYSSMAMANSPSRINPFTGMPMYANGGMTEDEYAEGGIPSLRLPAQNQKMQAVDMARAKMQTRQGLMEMQKAARDGDYAAQLALQDAGYDMNDLNQFASGGLSNLGDYSDGGRLLRGPGDGVSDSIPAVIGNRQPARLADGEFVVPARIVSELGNGSTEAGAKRLYAMMDRVQRARHKTVGKGKVAKDTNAEKYLPA